MKYPRYKAALVAVVMVASALLAGCGNDYGVDQAGQKVSAKSIDKHWLVINYWADWCGPCHAEIPQLNNLASHLPADTRMLGVNFDGLQGEDLRKAADALGIKFTVFASDPAALYDLPTNEGLPMTFIVDPNGKLRERLIGEQTAAGVSQKLAELQGLAVNKVVQ